MKKLTAYKLVEIISYL